MHKYYLWSTDNPYATRPQSYQRHFEVNLWAGIVNDHLIGAYLMPSRLDGDSYIVYYQEVLPKLVNPIPAHITRRLWFQHDGEPAHYSTHVLNVLDIMYPGRWIGRDGPINWPARSPDL